MLFECGGVTSAEVGTGWTGPVVLPSPLGSMMAADSDNGAFRSQSSSKVAFLCGNYRKPDGLDFGGVGVTQELCSHWIAPHLSEAAGSR